MTHNPKVITTSQIADVLSEHFSDRDQITCYLGSNAATPTASIEALTRSIEARSPKFPFIRMVHLLLQGPVPYLKAGLQDRIMAYSLFSTKEVREAANEGRAFYIPCTLANIESIIRPGHDYTPDFVILKVSQNPLTGEYSLGLSAEALHAAINHARLVIAELDPSMPFTQGHSIVDASTIDYLITEGVKPVYELRAPDFDNLSAAERRIGEQIAQHFISDGATLQVGIGKIPDAVVAVIRDGNFHDLGVQTELYGDGLMTLQKLDIITNRRKRNNIGYSATSLIMGSRELYDFVHMRTGVQMRPCAYTNKASVIQANAPFVAINTAMGADLFGNIWADYVDARRYYSGVGGQPDFVRALQDPACGTAIIAMKSITRDGSSKIVPAHPAGVSLTASSYDSVVLVTEFGIADLRGLAAGEKALAIASVCHPSYREEYLKSIAENELFTKPRHFSLQSVPKGVTPYEGSIVLE
ncbi:hypothetical protein AUK40_05540 [Candidatus Wirthbacteria bacterium CG2_30_54_11]|uniref:Uncharacterized protein n=1 Tax=Candidatus Wirthbacteria bacterium CG2_30_54_11 TaxID=1817892 RepID=A0A1J5IFS0_9BACT|nr:MAG: hypothetical protein AUK40_05540 [Candidatus Wirthbacteria bacterium CG2_30_54_11]